MRYLIIFLILNYSLTFMESPVQQSSAVALNPGMRAEMEGLGIKFKKVLSDSRCPKGVNCIWAGEAKILIEIYNGNNLLGEELLIVTNSSSSLPGLQKYESKVGILNLEAHLQPYPTIGKKIAVEDYCLNLQLTGKESDKRD